MVPGVATRRVLALASVLSCLSLARLASAQPVPATYAITEISPGDAANAGGAVSAAGISDGGYPSLLISVDDGSGAPHAFFGNINTIATGGTLSGPATEARHYSGGAAVGRVLTPSGAWHAAIVGGPDVADLGTLGGSNSFALGATRTLIVGASQIAGDSATRPFVFDLTTRTLSELPMSLSGTNATATAIAADGRIVGFADVPGTALHHAVLFANGVTTDVGSLGGSSEATALNTAGTVVGHFDTSDGSQIFRAFAWRNGVMQDLGTLGGARSDALDVGPGDVAVGWAENGSGEPRAFLWRNGTMSDLNDLLPAGSGWQLDVATAINDRGAIVGNGRLNGQPRAFMLMPPMDLWLNIAFHGNQLDTNIPNPHEAGTRLTVGSTVWANGPWTATGIKVVNVVSGPVEITAVRPGVSGGATCEQSGLTVTCTLRNFDYYRDVFIDLRATAAGIITHQAWIDASYPDPVPGNNSASETNRAVDLASFTLADSVVVGGAPVLGRVTLTSPVNPGGGTVPLRSSNPAVASVPSQFDVLPYCCDGLWREFYVTTVPVTQPVTVDVSAHYGLSTITLPLTILPSGGVWPYTGTPLVIPGTIEAEQFDLGSEGTAYHDTSTGNAGGAYRASGVDIEAVANTNDPSGGFNVGWLDDGEWLAYSVNVTTSSTYAVEARVACPGACGAFHLEVDGSDATGPIAIPATGGWQAWQTVRASVTLAAGAHRLRVVFHVTTPGGAVGNLDWIRFTPSATPTPFGGAPALIPGRIEAEAFDEGGEGVAYHDLSSENSGGASRATGVDLEPTSDPDDEDAGFNVGWIDAGEWLNYTVSVAEAGTYHLRLRVAAPADGGTLHLSAAGQDITGPLTIPDTGNWQAWIDLETSVNLAAGVQSLRVVFDARGSANLVGNLNFIEVTRE